MKFFFTDLIVPGRTYFIPYFKEIIKSKLNEGEEPKFCFFVRTKNSFVFDTVDLTFSLTFQEINNWSNEKVEEDSAFYFACGHNDIKKMTEILKNHPSSLNHGLVLSKDDIKFPLSFACSNGRLEVVDFLLNNELAKDNIDLSKGNPLSSAIISFVRFGDEARKIVDLLLKKNNEISESSKKLKDLDNALFFGAHLGKKELVEKLLKLKTFTIEVLRNVKKQAVLRGYSKVSDVLDGEIKKSNVNDDDGSINEKPNDFESMSVFCVRDEGYRKLCEKLLKIIENNHQRQNNGDRICDVIFCFGIKEEIGRFVDEKKELLNKGEKGKYLTFVITPDDIDEYYRYLVEKKKFHGYPILPLIEKKDDVHSVTAFSLEAQEEWRKKKELESFLERNDLEVYIELFEKEKIFSLEELNECLKDDPTFLEIIRIDDRIKFFKAMKKL